MNAMVFAAGEGTRLRPLTLTRPKALVEVAGKPMLARVIESVRAAGARKIVVNICYLGEQIISFLENNDFGVEIVIADERRNLLDTGGGLLAARRLFDPDEPILLHNADILTDLDLNSLHLRGLATLLVRNRPSSRHLVFKPEDMRLSGWVNDKTGETRGDVNGVPLAFNGIHVVSPEIFPLLEDYSRQTGSEVFSLTPFYVSAAARSEIFGQALDGYRWHDIGSPEKLLQAEKWLS